MKRILYFTDQAKMPQGYEPAFGKLLERAKIRRHEVLTTDLYALIDKPLVKFRNEKLARFNPDNRVEVERVVRMRIAQVKPTLIVVSCPVVLGMLNGWDQKGATLEKMRGGVYEIDGITAIVIYPITAVNRNIDARLVKTLDENAGDDSDFEPYRVPNGATILNFDWGKVGRFWHGRVRTHPPFIYSVCRTREDLLAARDWLTKTILIAPDIETGLYPPTITCAGYCGLMTDGSMRSFVIPFYDPRKESGCFWDNEEDHVLAYAVQMEINESKAIKTCQNGSYDNSYFIRDGAPTYRWLLDSMVMWWSIFMELPKSLDFISSIMLDNYRYWKDDIKGIESDGGASANMEQYWRYNALDCYNTLLNTVGLLSTILSDPQILTVYRDAMMRVFAGLEISMRGIKADKPKREAIRKKLEIERDAAYRDFHYITCAPDFNVNSPAQKVELLYGFMGLRPRTARGRYVDPKKPPKGTNAPSAGKIPLRLAKTEHPLFGYIIEKMEAVMTPDKQISNVCDMFLGTDRFRTSLDATGTGTTRYASKKSAFWDGSNAQNIRDDYQDWLVADRFGIFIDVDYSQSDDVFVAYESQDPDKIKVVESGKDAHAVNGELFFKRSYDSIVAGKKARDPIIVHPVTGIRQVAKRVVHGTNFQMAAMTLYVTMGREAVVAAALMLGFAEAAQWPQERLVWVCGELMAAYRAKYKRLNPKEWYKEIADELRATGKLVNAFGIARRFLGDVNDGGTQREGTGYIGQSDTAGNMNRCANEIRWGYIAKNFRDGPNPSFGDKPLRMDYRSHGHSFMLQVHDNWLNQFDTRHPKWVEGTYNLLKVMDRPIIIHGREVRIKTEAKIGIARGKNLVEWDKSQAELERIVSQLQQDHPYHFSTSNGGLTK